MRSTFGVTLFGTVMVTPGLVTILAFLVGAKAVAHVTLVAFAVLAVAFIAFFVVEEWVDVVRNWRRE